MRFFASSLIAAASLLAGSASAQTVPAVPPAPPAPAQAAPAAAPAAPAPVAAPAPATAPYAAPYPYIIPYYLPALERRSKAMMATGIALWGAGVVATVVGSVIFIQGVGSFCVDEAGTAGGPVPGSAAVRGSLGRHAKGERTGTARQAFDSCGGHPDLGFALLSAGQLVAMGGVPLFVLGNMKIPVRPGAEDAAAPQVRVGLGGVDLTWKF